jgi:hypothetical protein
MIQHDYYAPTPDELRRIALRNAEQRVWSAKRELEAAEKAFAELSE